MKALIKQLESQLKEYKTLVDKAEKDGVHNLDFEGTEFYGVFLGKKELLEDLIPKLKNLS